MTTDYIDKKVEKSITGLVDNIVDEITFSSDPLKSVDSKKQQLRMELLHNIKTNLLDDLFKGFNILIEETDKLGKEFSDKMSSLGSLFAEGSLAIAATDEKMAQEFFTADGTIQSKLKLDDDVLELWYQIGRKFYDAKHFEDAARVFKVLIFLNPLVENYYISLGMTNQAMHHVDEAIALYSLAIAMQEQNPFPCLKLAECYEAMSDHAKAIDVLELAILYSERDKKYADFKTFAMNWKNRLKNISK